MEIKKHFKLYKAGKTWCCAAIATIALGTGMALGSSVALADDTPSENTTAMTTSSTEQEPAVQTDSSQTESVKKVNKSITDENPASNVEAIKTAAADDSSQRNAETVPAAAEPETFKTVNGNTYYYGKNGKLYQNQFYNNLGKTYYFQENGARLDNSFYHNWGHSYYFGNDGALYTNQFLTKDNKTYYFDNQGIMYQNQFYNNWGHTYYFGSDGARWDNRFYNNWGNTYYFGNDGARWDNRYMVKWGSAYYFGKDGALVKNQTKNVNGNSYWINNDGVIPLRNQFLTANENQLYYFDSKGTLVANKFYHNWGHTYYFGSDGARYTNQFLNMNGKVYYFDNQGIMYQNQYYKNWGNTYYFGKNGARYTDQFLNKDGKLYYFDNDGVMYQDKYYKNWGHTYYFGKDGARYTNQFLNKDGKLYYFDNDGVMYQDEYYKNWGNTYYFGKDGARYTNQFLNKDGQKYYFDGQGIMLTDQLKVIDGKGYQFNAKGEITKVYDAEETRNAVAQDIAKTLTSQGIKNVKYDWQNQTNHYQELALHDIAQEVAQGDTNADKNVIAQKLHDDSLLDGKVLVVYTTNFSDADSKEIAKNCLNSYDFENANDSVVGVGADVNKDKLVVVVFKPGQAINEAQATSSLTAITSAIYDNGKNVKDALAINSDITSNEVGNALNSYYPALLTGKKGSTIDTQTLTSIFASLPGNSTALQGTKNYYNGNDAYHYEFWLVGNNADDKLNNFLKLNKDVKYGDPLKVNYSATLTWGKAKPTQLDMANTTPASKKTAEELDLAYQTGSEIGLKYDSVKVKPVSGMINDTIRGVDVSSYQTLLNAGVKFYDFNGHPANLFKVLSDAGVNYIRLRLWNDPYNADGKGYAGGTNDEVSLINMAKEATKYGMKVLLDFHYSDFWADPAKQPLPKAWKNLSSDALKKEVYLYTAKVVNDLKVNGVNLGMVQIGNEITNGVFGIYSNRDAGESWSNIWSDKNKAAQICEYLSAASQAIRENASNVKIAIQLETPNIDKYRSILTAIKDNNVDYDYLGTSYYPFWSTGDNNGSYDGQDLGTGANTPKNLTAVENMVQKEFGKKTVVLETGWINNKRDADGTGNSVSDVIDTYSHDPQGQVDAMADMYKAILAGNGIGGFYWEPAWIPVKAGWDNWDYNKQMSNQYGTGWASKYATGYAPDSVMFYEGKPTWGGTTWDNVTLFDDHGYPLQSLNMYKGFLNGYKTN
ncbi:glycosyl hydrolase 53 family protein [Limosilactobacillus caccae]|uniref:glycosyl hydrolase 53 family protein n=1 Tax=Limosilactobacillus caccae TaxID=1926284 RepID=UPI000970AF86|nr:glycosyl hydrolase 53 family protein [Limosilactobacillus caccae]